MKTSSTTKVVVVRADAGRGVQSLRCRVEADGTVRVWDSVAGHYTLCHSLTARAQARIRRLARAAN